MKQFKGLIAAAAASAVLVCGALFSACAQDSSIGAAKAEVRASDAERVVIEVTEGDTSKSLYDALTVFQEEEKLTFSGSESEYGFYITSVNGVEAAGDSYWAVYTTLGTLDGTSYSDAQWGTFEYEGKTLASASYGVSGLPLVEGEYYALVWTAM